MVVSDKKTDAVCQTVVNYYRNVKSPEVEKSVPLSEWFDMIKGSKLSPVIELARGGGMDYDYTKVNLMPCVTYNFLYEGYKNNDNMLSATGVLFIDIDNPDFNPAILNLDHILSYYKSFGGEGYCVLVRVDPIDNDSYKPTLLNIIDILGITEYYDKGASKATQFSVLSYDPDIFINLDSTIFPVIHNTDKKTQSLVLPKERKVQLDGSFSGDFRLNNLEDFTKGIDFKGELFIDLADAPIKYVRVCVPKNLSKGNRNSGLFTVCSQVYGINPHLSRRRLVNFLLDLNRKVCYPALPEEEVAGIAYSCVRQGPSIKENSVKRILFNPDYDLTAKERRSVATKYLNRDRGNKTTAKLKDKLSQWDIYSQGKITYEKLAEFAGVSLNTAKRRGEEIKPYMKKINKEFGKLNKK